MYVFKIFIEYISINYIKKTIITIIIINTIHNHVIKDTRTSTLFWGETSKTASRSLDNHFLNSFNQFLKKILKNPFKLNNQTIT